MGAWRVTLVIYLFCRLGKTRTKVVPDETLVRRRSSRRLFRRGTVVTDVKRVDTQTEFHIHGIALFHQRRVSLRAHSACVFNNGMLGFTVQSQVFYPVQLLAQGPIFS
jgi:hypothetical protein